MNEASLPPVTPAANPGEEKFERRLTHKQIRPSRSISAVIIAVIVILAGTFIAKEGIYAISGHDVLWVTPSELARRITIIFTANPQWALLVAAGVLVVLGLILFLKGLFPGSRDRHRLPSDSAVIIAEDEVIAAAVSRALRERLALPPGQVWTAVSKKKLVAEITPTTGLPIAVEDAQSAVSEICTRFGLPETLRRVVKVNTEGRVQK